MAKIAKRLQAARGAFDGKEDISVEAALSLIKANAWASIRAMRTRWFVAR
jgi:large subunit ribosomal protein L1